MTRVTESYYQELDSIDLDESPDSIERCPNEKDSLFICCTYELLEQENDQTPAHLMNRKGSVILFTVKNGKLVKLTETRTEAILDSKWKRNCNNGDFVFATADAKGCIRFYSLVPDPHNISPSNFELNDVGHSNSAENGLCLSLDWCKDGAAVASSDSNGHLSINSITPDGPVKSRHWKAHDAEAWITLYDYWDSNIIYSGADDCKFCGWDIRSESRTFMNSSHQAGVCSIQCNTLSPFTVATGSYDEYVRIWDTRNIRRQPVSEVHTGGGVWRIKWHTCSRDIMLIACMFGGFNVVNFNNMASPVVSHTFNSAEGSLAYGVDWITSQNDDDMIASCTFYDKKLSIGSLKSS